MWPLLCCLSLVRTWLQISLSNCRSISSGLLPFVQNCFLFLCVVLCVALKFSYSGASFLKLSFFNIVFHSNVQSMETAGVDCISC